MLRAVQSTLYDKHLSSRHCNRIRQTVLAGAGMRFANADKTNGNSKEKNHKEKGNYKEE